MRGHYGVLISGTHAPRLQVTPRERLELKRIAEKLRATLSEGKSSGFNVVACVRALAQREILRTGKLVINFFNASTQQTPAYVTYNPTTLHVDFGTWQDADLGTDRSLYYRTRTWPHPPS